MIRVFLFLLSLCTSVSSLGVYLLNKKKQLETFIKVTSCQTVDKVSDFVGSFFVHAFRGHCLSLQSSASAIPAGVGPNHCQYHTKNIINSETHMLKENEKSNLLIVYLHMQIMIVIALKSTVDTVKKQYNLRSQTIERRFRRYKRTAWYAMNEIQTP